MLGAQNLLESGPFGASFELGCICSRCISVKKVGVAGFRLLRRGACEKFTCKIRYFRLLLLDIGSVNERGVCVGSRMSKSAILMSIFEWSKVGVCLILSHNHSKSVLTDKNSISANFVH